MFYCSRCGRPFIMRSYMKNHICDADKELLKEEPEEKTKKELVAQAKDLNIKGADRMTKDEVIEAINEAESDNA